VKPRITHELEWWSRRMRKPTALRQLTTGAKRKHAGFPFSLHGYDGDASQVATNPTTNGPVP